MNITYIESYYRIVIMNTTDFKEKEEDKYILTLLIPE